VDVLRQAEPISTEEQRIYFSEYVWPCMNSNHPRQILLAIERSEKFIGYGGLVHCDWQARRAEISFLLRPDLEAQEVAMSKIFSEYLEMIYQIAFGTLGFNRLTTETYEFRKTHLQVMEDSGLKCEGVFRDHVFVGGELKNSYVHGILASDWRSRSEGREAMGILVTSASRKVPLIWGLRDAARRLEAKLEIIAGDVDDLAIARFEADDFWKMPRLDSVGVMEIVDECQRRGIKLIFPTRDGELDFWARNLESFTRAGISVVVSQAAGIARCRDKLSFARFGKVSRLPIIPASESPDEFSGCLYVVKERFGSASIGLALGLTKDKAVAHAKALRQPIFQPFVIGTEISIDSWISKTGEVPGVVLRRRDAVLGGESQITTTFRDERLENEALTVVKTLGLRGPVVLQAILTDGGLKVIECNPRFGGASNASIYVGLDSLYWSLAEAFGNGFTPVFHRATNEVRQVRYPVDRVIHGSCF
jgi:RimJ/RimL family protein N-acetyltransferase/glutathione synthase/RimK-type ligase-like ATP-grasp enzyme